MFFSRVVMIKSNVPFNPRAVPPNVYQEHKFIWEFFPEDKNSERDFIYRRFDTEHALQFYILSKRKPKTQNGPWAVETKMFNPIIQMGSRYAFQLRANAITVKAPEGRESKKRKKVDVFMDALHKNKELPVESRTTNNEILVQSGLQWLRSRANYNGYAIQDSEVIVEGYTRLSSGSGIGKKNIQLGAIDFNGILKVEDKTKFERALFQGIGSAKAFGCGLFLLKPL